MNSKNIRLYIRDKSYFIVDQYQNDLCCYDEDAYYYYDFDVDRISFKKMTMNILLGIIIQIKPIL